MKKTFGYLKDEVCELIGVKGVLCELGDFVEGSMLVLAIDGKLILRRVRYNTAQGLHVKINGYAVSFDDFE